MGNHTVIAVSEDQRDELKAICDSHGCSYSELIGCIMKEVDIESLNIEGGNKGRGGIQEAKNRVPEVKEILHESGTPEDVVAKAASLLETAHEKGYCERQSARVLAASSEYGARLLMNEKKTQPELCEKHGVSIPSIRKTYHRLFEANGLIGS